MVLQSLETIIKRFSTKNGPDFRNICSISMMTLKRELTYRKVTRKSWKSYESKSVNFTGPSCAQISPLRTTKAVRGILKEFGAPDGVEWRYL